MKLVLRVRIDDVIHCFSFLDGSDYSFIYFPNHFVISVFKVHNHSYFFKAFFYNSLHIVSDFYCNSKLKLFRALQSLLKDELYDVVLF